MQSGELKLAVDSIFFNNFFIAMMLFLGAISFGLITALMLITNGLFVGYYATNLPLAIFLPLTLPHGIFEISGIIIAATGGFTLISFIAHFLNDLTLFEKNKWGERPNFQDRIKSSFNKNYKIISQSLILLGVATALLILAAFIEVYVTIYIANFIIKI